MIDIAFFYVAEAYQCYHSAAVAFALAGRPGVRVSILYNDPATPRHIARIGAALSAAAIECRSVRLSPLAWALRRFPRFGLSKRIIMRENARALNSYDAIVAVENTTAMLRTLGVHRPKLVYIPHGSGDRARSFLPRIADFDLVLPAGAKNARRMLAQGVIRAGHYATPGYVKLETALALRDREPSPFRGDRPVLLYNPHAMRDLCSWDRFIEPLMTIAEKGDEFDLIVAPHIKLFARRTPAERQRWEQRSGEHVLVDLGSDRLLDMSHAMAADVYVGDVSSQVYEFLAVPRPCVFLNAHGVAWRGNPDYLNWTFGEVVDDPAALLPALCRAQARHGEFRGAQEQAVAGALGDRTAGSAMRAADAIVRFLAEGSLEP